MTPEESAAVLAVLDDARALAVIGAVALDAVLVAMLVARIDAVAQAVTGTLAEMTANPLRALFGGSR